MRVHFHAVLALGCTLAKAHVMPATRQSAVVEPYVPYTAACPSGSLIRLAKSLNPDEESYVEQRRTKASQALSIWLGQALEGGAKTDDLPTLALALSGGGPKAGLAAAGSIYGLDGREDSASPVAGLLQSMTYISALSGGTLTLSGMIQNDFAKISTLRRDLYQTSYQNVIAAALSNSAQIRADVGNKSAAGYPTTIVDTFGRVIAFDFIAGPPQGANNDTWSSVTGLSSYQNHNAPFPIMTITQSNVPTECEPRSDGAIWEVSPLEFGSWDDMVGAFYPTEYMGTTPQNSSGQCTVGFDNTGLISGISSNILITEDFCTTGNYSLDKLSPLASLINTAFPNSTELNPYGIIPNPFYESSETGVIRNQEEIFGTDGGDSGQGIPIFPFIQPTRNVDVIFIVDTESSDATNITDGSSLYATYLSAQENDLTKMPAVPTVEEFAAQNLSSRAQFFGCHDPEVTTLIFLPDTELGFITSSTFLFAPEQLNRTFDGGLAMVTQSQQKHPDLDWPTCLACGILHKKSRDLPEACTACLDAYCWDTQNSTAPEKPDTSCANNGAIVCNGPTRFGICNYGQVRYQPVAAGTECKNGSLVATGGTDCSDDGAVVCNGSDQFGVCNFGSVSFGPVAAGTKCQGGEIVAA